MLRPLELTSVTVPHLIISVGAPLFTIKARAPHGGKSGPDGIAPKQRKTGAEPSTGGTPTVNRAVSL